MSKAGTRKFTRRFDIRMTDIFGVPDEIVGYRFKKMFERASAESSFYWENAKITIELEEREKKMTAEWKYTLFYENGGEEKMKSFNTKEEMKDFLEKTGFRSLFSLTEKEDNSPHKESTIFD